MSETVAINIEGSKKVDFRRCESSPASLVAQTPETEAMTNENESVSSLALEGRRVEKTVSNIHSVQSANDQEDQLDVVRSFSTPPISSEHRERIAQQQAEESTDEEEEKGERQEGQKQGGVRLTTLQADDDEGDDLLEPVRQSALSPKAAQAANKGFGDLKLGDAWTIWFDRAAPQSQGQRGGEQHQNCIVELASFDSVKGFWDYWNTLKVENLKTHCNLRLFKKGVKPLATDSANAQGGKWVVRGVPVSSRKSHWTDMALALISERIQEYTTSKVCGAVLSTREGGDSLQVWVDSRDTRTNDSSKPPISEALKRLFFPQGTEPYTSFIYQTHQELQEAREDVPDRRRSAPTRLDHDSDDSIDEEFNLISPTENHRRHVHNDGEMIRGAISSTPTGSSAGGSVGPSPTAAAAAAIAAVRNLNKQQRMHGYTAATQANHAAAAGRPPQHPRHDPASTPSQPTQVGLATFQLGQLPMPMQGTPYMQPGTHQPYTIPHVQSSMPQYPQQQTTAVSNYLSLQGQTAVSPALQMVQRTLTREHSGGVHSTDEESGHDEDLTEEMRIIQERAKQIRTLKKKIRYISFFLQREGKGRELTPSEKQRINSLPSLQSELQQLESIQAVEMEVQKHLLGVDNLDFLKKPQQSMTFTTESERRFKTMRALRKKIRFVHYHMERQKQGKVLSPAEQSKVLSLPEMEAQLQKLEADEAAWQRQNGGHPRRHHKEEAEESMLSSSTSSIPLQPSVVSSVDTFPLQTRAAVVPSAIADLQAQITAQRRELEDRQRRIEALIKTQHQKLTPQAAMRTTAGFHNPHLVAQADTRYGHVPPHVLSGPPPLDSPVMSPPVSPPNLS